MLIAEYDRFTAGRDTARIYSMFDVDNFRWIDIVEYIPECHNHDKAKRYRYNSIPTYALTISLGQKKMHCRFA